MVRARLLHTRGRSRWPARLQPPQCLLEFLNEGGNANAHPVSEDAFSRDSLLQLAAESAGPRVVELLLQRGADIDGTLTRCSPLELAVRRWQPITKMCRPGQAWPGDGCPDFADRRASVSQKQLLKRR